MVELSKLDGSAYEPTDLMRLAERNELTDYLSSLPAAQLAPVDWEDDHWQVEPESRWVPLVNPFTGHFKDIAVVVKEDPDYKRRSASILEREDEGTKMVAQYTHGQLIIFGEHEPSWEEPRHGPAYRASWDSEEAKAFLALVEAYRNTQNIDKPSSELTILERVWYKPDEHLFVSRRHHVMAAVDAFPRLPLQAVVAPQFGTKGKPAHFNALPPEMRRKLHEVADTVGGMIMQRCEEGQRAMTHIEGFGVSDHPHIVLFAAEQGQGANLYDKTVKLGNSAVEHALNILRLTEDEAAALERRLDKLS
jgi:hypothetical protein